MKTKKKKVAVVALIVCIVAILSLSSLAWFTADDTITNNLVFDTDFSVDLYETNGKGGIIREDGETVGQTYSDILPGDTLYKDPTVINKSSNASEYIRLTVTVDNYATWANSIEAGSDLTAVFSGFDAAAWTRYDAPTVSNDAITYVFYLNAPLAPGATATLFTGVNIPTGVTLEEAEAMGTCHIVVKAEAIQVANVGASGENACYDAFTTVMG